MRHLIVVVVLLGGCGSTPNPESCLDGSCTDSAFPYCDVEGLFALPGTCVDVSCSAGELAGCRDDRAITCNSTGNNYDLVECPNGCDASGCVPLPDCTTDAECTNPAPICDASQTCRGCRLDDECPSSVCDVDTGACVAEAAVMYAAPGGSVSGGCGLTTPCTIARASGLVVASGTTKTLRLLPGMYNESLILINGGVVKAVATGATIGQGNSNVTVKNGSTLDIRGLVIQASASVKALDMETLGGSLPATLTFRDGSIQGMPQTAYSTNATIYLRGVLHQGNWLVGDGTTIEVDRSRFNISGILQAGNGSATLRFTNNLFVNSDITARRDLGVAFNTFVFTNAGSFQSCSSLDSATSSRFENNILYATTSTGYPYAATAGMCRWSNNIVFPQNTPIPGNIVVDPKIVDVAGGDYHVLADSPARNAGVPAVDLTTGHDHDGVSRPQGVAHDIGAYELIP